MPKFPLVSAKETIKALSNTGFQIISQRGSHVKLRKIAQNEIRTVIVPMKKIIQIGTMKSILRQANLSLEEFIQLLR